MCVFTMEEVHQQIAAGRHYCVVDDANDIPATEQIRARMEGQMGGVAPAKIRGFHSPTTAQRLARAIFFMVKLTIGAIGKIGG